MKTINWGILGCANIAEGQLIPGLLQATNARLYGIASRGGGDKLAHFADKFKPVKTYTSYEALLEDPEIDAVYIPLPNGLHAEWVIKAAEYKKHILCEKPLGANAVEVQAMQKACLDNQVLLMEAFAYRHNELLTTVQEIIREGKIGQIQLVESHLSFPLTELSNVRLNANLKGGATYDTGCYNIDLITTVLDAQPVSVKAFGQVGVESGVDEMSSAIMTFENGAQAYSFCSFHAADRNEYIIQGYRGVLKVSPAFNATGPVEILLQNESGEEVIRVDCGNPYQQEVEQFGRCIAGEDSLLVTAQSSLRTARVIDQILEQIQAD